MLVTEMDNDIVICMQALQVIRELQKHYPIKRSPMRVRLTVPEQNYSSLLEKLNQWNASIVTKEGSGNQQSVVSPDLVLFVKHILFPELCMCKLINLYFCFAVQ